MRKTGVRISVPEFYHTLLNNFCISCDDELLTGWSPDRGHPRPSHCWAPVYRGCPCRGPTGVMTHPGRMMSHQSANPILLHCTGFLLRCTELRLDYTDCTLDVFTCNITKLDQCCVLIIRRKKIKPNWDVTWRYLHGWNTQLNLTRPLSHVSTRSHSQSYCWCVLSIFDSFTASCLGISLPLWTVRFTCFLIRIISCPLTSINTVMVENSFFNSIFNLRLLFRPSCRFRHSSSSRRTSSARWRSNSFFACRRRSSASSVS